MDQVKYTREITLGLAVVAASLLLLFVPFDDTKVALYRLDYLLRQERSLSEDLNGKCNELTSDNPGMKEKFFLKRFRLASSGNGTGLCRLFVEASNSHRFHLVSDWHFQIRVLTDAGAQVSARYFSVKHPRPLALLPIVFFILAMVFGYFQVGISFTLSTYLLMVAGLNIIEAIRITVKSATLTLATDQTFHGLFLVLIWISLYRSSSQNRRANRVSRHPIESWVSRIITTLIGLWSPFFYTISSRILVPFRGTVQRLTPFLDSQFAVFALSLYLLNWSFDEWREFAERSLLLPRYLTFAALLFLVVSYWTSKPKRHLVLWRLPRFAGALLSVALMELSAWRLPILREFPTLTRVGLALILSELAWPVHIQWKEAFRNLVPVAAALFLGSFVAVMSHEAGITDLAMVLWEPNVHPNSMVIYTFIVGLCLGFITGSFSASYFALNLLLATQETSLIRAALLDGILAGTLLSPISLFNLIPSSFYGVKLHQLVEFRFKQLSYPISIAFVIYAIGTINSVAILQPVTFAFLCLVAIAIQLKRSRWSIDDEHFFRRETA